MAAIGSLCVLREVWAKDGRWKEEVAERAKSALMKERRVERGSFDMGALSLVGVLLCIAVKWWLCGGGRIFHEAGYR